MIQSICYTQTATYTLRLAIFIVIIHAFTAVSDWLFPQLQGMASDNTLKLLAWADFAVSLVVAWWVAQKTVDAYNMRPKAI